MPPSCPECGTNVSPKSESGYCRRCYQRRWQAEHRGQPGNPRVDYEPVIEITPEIATWALLETAFWTDQDWRLIRELPPYVPEAA